MERWQQLGFESFLVWRRATEKAGAERVKKRKKQQTNMPIVAAITEPVEVPASVEWQPVQLLNTPSQERSPPHSPSQAAWPCLPGKLHEHVQMTPQGRRVHTFNHVSPGGTLRVNEHASPAGPQQPLGCSSRGLLGVSAWRLSGASLPMASTIQSLLQRGAALWVRSAPGAVAPAYRAAC